MDNSIQNGAYAERHVYTQNYEAAGVLENARRPEQKESRDSADAEPAATVEISKPAYAAYAQKRPNNDAYFREKEIADRHAKKISDKYAETINFKLERLGLIKKDKKNQKSNEMKEKLRKL